MRFTSLILRTSYWLLLILFLYGCVGEECGTFQDPVMRVSFARFTNAERTTEEAISVAFTEISGIDALAENKSLVTSGTSIAGLLMPLSQKENESSFVFKREGLPDETVTFSYTRKPYFISQACGFEMEYENIKVISDNYTNIIEVQVVQPSVNAQRNDVNVKIYFR